MNQGPYHTAQMRAAMLRQYFEHDPLSGAVLSNCERYRYLLWRRWNPDRPGQQLVTFIMLNPSTADATKDDPTIRKCIGFAKRWDFDGILIVNLFAFRATQPADLKREPSPVDEGPGWSNGTNDNYIELAVENCQRVICAWGNHGSLLQRSEKIRRKLLLNYPNRAFSLGPLTKVIEPKHPLYVKYDIDLLPMP